MIFFSICFSALVASASPLGAADDLDCLIGEWKVTAIATHSELEPFVGKQHVEIDSKRLTFFGEKGKKWSLKILSLADGKVDFKKEFRPHDGDTVLGIYELKDDELRICYRIYGTPTIKKDPPPRPTEFASPKDSNLMVYVLKRIKKE